MRIWSVVSQKGGTGKTTLVLHLAVAAALKTRRTVVVIDIDCQTSAEQWTALRESSKNAPIGAPGLPCHLAMTVDAARRAGCEHVLIDTPPFTGSPKTSAAAAADLVIVPTRSSILDQRALADTLTMLQKAQGRVVTSSVPNQPVRFARKATSGMAVQIAQDRRMASRTCTMDRKGQTPPKMPSGKQYEAGKLVHAKRRLASRRKENFCAMASNYNATRKAG